MPVYCHAWYFWSEHLKLSMKNYSGFESCYLLERIEFPCGWQSLDSSPWSSCGSRWSEAVFQALWGASVLIPFILGYSLQGLSWKPVSSLWWALNSNFCFPKSMGLLKSLLHFFFKPLCRCFFKTSLLILFCNEAFPDRLPYGMSHHYHSFCFMLRFMENSHMPFTQFSLMVILYISRYICQE